VVDWQHYSSEENPMARSEKLLRVLIDELAILFEESLAYEGIAEARAVLAEARDLTLQFRRRLIPVGGRYVIAFAGMTNVGKSTLMNALLGAEIAPRLNGPCTSVAVEFEHGPQYSVTVRTGSVLSQRYPCNSVEHLNKYLESLASTQGEGANPFARYIQVTSPKIPAGMVLADTPGFGAVEASGEIGSHEEALKNYLAHQASQVFWIVLAEQGIGRREAGFYEKFLMEKCNDIVVTGSEGWDVGERARFRQRFFGTLRQPLLRFHFASGKDGCEAREKGSEAMLEASGVKALESELKKQANGTTRMSDVEDGALNLAKALAEWQKEFSEDHPRFARGDLWRPDSWARWQSVAPNLPLKVQLDSALSGRY
jgi:GTP-binding protein EngB required for normal cell division